MFIRRSRCVCMCGVVQAVNACKWLRETNTSNSIETDVDTNVGLGSCFMSSSGIRQVSSRRSRPASIQLVDHYDQIPADHHQSSAEHACSARRHASVDNLASDRNLTHRLADVKADRAGVIAVMRRKPSYDDSDVILIDNALYGTPLTSGGASFL